MSIDNKTLIYQLPWLVNACTPFDMSGAHGIPRVISERPGTDVTSHGI
jgi:hypothetical protein